MKRHPTGPRSKDIIEMMYFNRHKTRWLVTVSLIVSLGLTGLFPQMMAGAASGVVVGPVQQSTQCCCGTETSQCCGMGCCGVRAPSPKKGPSPAPDESRTAPQAIAFAKAMIGDGDNGHGALFVRPSSDADRSSAASSLQAKLVRLDA